MTTIDTAAMKRKTRFWDRMADGYARSPVADEASYQKKLEITRGYLTRESEVLEFGCGTGSTALAHAPHVRHILATDISGRMVEIACSKAAAAGLENVTFVQSTLDDLEMPDASFDAVLGLSILHLLEDWPAAIARAYALLRPGGVLVTSTMCIADSHPWLGRIAPLGRHIGLLPWIGVFRKATLVAAMTAAGFVIEHEFHPGRRKAVFLVCRKP